MFEQKAIAQHNLRPNICSLMSELSDANRKQLPCWLQERSPECIEMFPDTDLLSKYLEGIKDELYSDLTETLRVDGIDTETVDIGLCVILSKPYSGIYFVNRPEAAVISEHLTRAKSQDISRWNTFFTQPQNVSNLFNKAIGRFIARRVHDGRVRTSLKKLPDHAIFAAGPDALYMNQGDIQFACSQEISFSPLYDLHDFSHLLAASYSQRSFGVKLFEDYLDLPGYFRVLITSQKFKTPDAIPFSDGLLFSELSRGPFDSHLAEHPDATDIELQAVTSRALKGYLLGTRPLQQISTGIHLLPSTPIHPEQLVALMQNKIAEYSASKLERAVFVRGGERDGSDSLATLTPVDFYEKIIEAPATYKERRNFIRHRAYTRALYETALAIFPQINNETHKDLVQKAIHFYENGYVHSGEVKDMYGELKRIYAGKAQTGFARAIHLTDQIKQDFAATLPVFIIAKAKSSSDGKHTEFGDSHEPSIEEDFRSLCNPHGGFRDTQLASQRIVKRIFDQITIPTHSVFVPILRGGLPLLQEAYAAGEYPTTFIQASKDKLDRSVTLSVKESDNILLKNGNDFVILDTVIANGDTIISVVEYIREKNSHANILIASCYATPESITRILTKHPLGVSVYSAVLAERVDNEGYLIPYTHGDIGDKMYGGI